MSDSSFVKMLKQHNADAGTVLQVCYLIVESWSTKDVDDMYREMIEHAKDPAALDLMLYLLDGDVEYAENAALIVLSSAWNYPQLHDAIEDLVAAVTAQDDHTPHRRAGQAVLYGMYLLARDHAQVKEVTFRNADGKFETHALDSNVPADALFESVQAQYGVTM